MPLFGRHAPCPHCGKRVREPKDPEDFTCHHCGSLGPWASEEQARGWIEDRERQLQAEAARKTATTRHQELLGQLVAGADIETVVPALRSAALAAGLTEQDQLLLRTATLRSVTESAVADQLLTPDESARLDHLATGLGITLSGLGTSDPDLGKRIFVATVNGGRLPEVRSPTLMAKKGEIVHLEWPATLMKEVAVREYQGGYSGFSFPIGKTGVRYRVGGSKGHSVQVGTQLQVADTGTLAVTNKRVVYMGTRKTLDMPYSRLVNLTVYSDAIQFHLSNRVNAPLFAIEHDADTLAAVVNAAAQRAD